MSALETLEAIFVKEITEAAKTKPLALVVKPSNATASSPELVTFDLAVFDTFTKGLCWQVKLANTLMTLRP